MPYGRDLRRDMAGFVERIEWTPERVRGDGVVWAYGAVVTGVVAVAGAATGAAGAAITAGATTGVVASGGSVAR
ncbi:hypothetical protein WR25_20577 [Diploscapter pachys]|uniref:Uncharacterized protein n=1 Tax=Diploscapter pachys TaxID=2018661 RepID=A0A2A2M307_9BILA|nr:hypothetical protein WR25_20577 [Diploscapter pachys]